MVLCAVLSSSAAAAGLAAEDHVFPAPAVDATNTETAIAPNGFAAAAWVETLSGSQSRVDVSVRPPGGDWSAFQPLGVTAMTVIEVHVTIDSAGDAAVAWEDVMSPSTFVANVATRVAGGSFGAPETLNNAEAPRVGVDAAGNVTFLYDIVNSMGGNGEYVRTAPAGEPVLAGVPDTLSSTCSGFGPDLAVSPSGDAIAGWGCSGDVAFAVRTAGTWGATAMPLVETFVPCPGPGGASFGEARVAMDGQGHPIAVAERTDTQNDCMGGTFTTRKDSIVLAVVAGGALTAGPTVATSGTGVGINPTPNDVSLPTVGIGAGSVVVGWRAADANGFHSQAATRTYPGNGVGSPGAVQLFGDPAAATIEDRVSVDPAGDTLLTWTTVAAGGKPVIFAAFRPSGGAFGQALAASDGAGDATGLSSRIDDQGDGIVGWVEAQGNTHSVHARAFDATPPTLSGVSIPASATAGTPALFAAQAVDLWDPVSLSWSFGDGTAVGANPSHVFLAAGPHVVTVTATDSAGNATSQSGMVIVTAPPATGSLRPVLSQLLEKNSVFRVGARPTPIASAAKRRAPIGTTFRFSLNQPATVTITFSRATTGRRSGNRCVKQTKRLAHGKRCTRFVTTGVLTRHGQPGSNSVAFSGRLGRRALVGGTYRATFVATAGSTSSIPKTLRFTIVS